MWLLNSDEEIKDKLTLITAVHKQVLNGQDALEFSCIEKVEKNDRVIYKDNLNVWHEFIVQEVTETKESNLVYAENSIFELHGDFVDDRKPEGTPIKHLEIILKDTRWAIGIVGGFSIKKGAYYRINAYDALSNMCDLFEGYRTPEIIVKDNKIINRVIHISPKSGEDNGKRFTYSKDLIDVERTVLIGDIITALYGFGRGEEIGDGFGRRINFSTLDKPDSPTGKMYVEDTDALKKFGRNSPNGKVHVYGKYEFDDIEDIEELYEATRIKLHELNKPRINYRADVVLLGEKHENVRIGDNVAIIDNDFRGEDLRLKGIVFKIDRDLLNPDNSVIELGNYVDDIADADKKLLNFVNTVRSKSSVWDRSNAFDKDGNLDLDIPDISNILEMWNAELNSSGGYVYAEPGEGILAYDAPIDEDPQSVIMITGAGFRIANSKTSDGDWEWKTIGTGDGIYGEHIMAESITVNHLASEVGSSLDISSNESMMLEVQKRIEGDEGVIEEMSALIKNTGETISLEFKDLEERVDETDVSLDELKTYYRYSKDEAIIGKEGDPMQFYSSNDETGFRENGERISYWKGRVFYVENLHVLTTIIIGSHMVEASGDKTIVRSVK